MKSQQKAKLKSLSQKELTAQLLSLQKNLVETRMQIALRKEKNVKKMSNIRKDIARIKTILREQTLTGQK